MTVSEEKILTMMESAANRALNMVNLSLDLYRMESGSYVSHPGRVDLIALVQAVAQDLKAQAQSKNVTIQVSEPGWGCWPVLRSLCATPSWPI